MKIRYLNTLDYFWFISLYKISNAGKLTDNNKGIVFTNRKSTSIISKVISLKRIKPRFGNFENWIEVTYYNRNNRKDKIYITGGLFGPNLEEITSLFSNYLIAPNRSAVPSE